MYDQEKVTFRSGMPKVFKMVHKKSHGGSAATKEATGGG